MKPPTHPLRFGLQTWQQGVAWDALLDAWRKADAWGYDSLWLYDHFYSVMTERQESCLEGWTLLAALAMATRRARLGHLVNGVAYRNPYLLAKMAVTVDHVSDGRLDLGLGSGWFELEHRSLGIEFKSVRERLESLDETCRIVRSLFTAEQTTLHGRHHRVDQAVFLPKSRQSPHPPLMLGGMGRRVMLRLVAAHADMWNGTGPPERLAELIDVIRRHGDALGRDTNDIEMTVNLPFAYRAPASEAERIVAFARNIWGVDHAVARANVMTGSASECQDTVARYRRAGITHFIFLLVPPFDLEAVQAFAEDVVPGLR
jgi:F420-dependent oxidoreductase-like protein